MRRLAFPPVVFVCALVLFAMMPSPGIAGWLASPGPDGESRSEVDSAPVPGRERMRHAITGYMGPSVTSNFTSIFVTPQNLSYEATFIAAMAYNYEVWRLTDHLSMEFEGNIARRFGNANLWEFAATALVRWDNLPWNDKIYTTLGVAIGPSYATKITESERVQAGGEGSKILNTFTPEITFAPPDNQDLTWVFRVHHRSGVFGLINNVYGGSSFITGGLRYRF